MRLSQNIVKGETSWWLGPAEVPVDRFTRYLIRDLRVVISADNGWAVLNAKPFCHRWLLRRVRNHPIQLTYDISFGDGWQKFTVPVAVAV